MTLSPLRRGLLTAATLFVFAAPFIAGPAAAQRFRGELLIGLSTTTLSGESAADFSLKTSLAGGLAMGYDFGNGFTLQPELLYLSKGATATMPLSVFSRLLGSVNDNPGGDDPDVDLRWDLTYLEVPLLAVYRFETRTRFHPEFYAGPAVALNLDARVRFSVAGSNLSFSEEDDSIQNVDYGFVVGGGVEIETGLERLTLGARATLGRANTRERKPTIRNTGFVFFAGIVL